MLIRHDPLRSTETDEARKATRVLRTDDGDTKETSKTLTEVIWSQETGARSP